MEFTNVFLSIFFLFISKVIANEDSRGYLRREHSIFKGAGPSIPYWDFRGSTFISSSYIRLTPDHQSKRGGLWNSVPCHVKDWEMLLHFKVHGVGDMLFGDGFSFWYTKERMQEGDVFGSKDYFYGLGIFFDTYSNHNGEHQHEHPYISAMIGNGSVHYDHDRDGTLSQVAGCSANFRGRGHDTYALIRYSGTQNRLTLFVDVDNKNEWTDCFDVSGVKLPTGLYFGASAATGQLADNHDIISMKFYETEIPVTATDDEGDVDRSRIVPVATGAEPYRERVEDVQGSFSSRTVKVFTWLFWFALVACCVIGVSLYVYQKRQEDSRKRFY
ncbi:vesicular integral-membrane protein VIP36-like [Orbicella faveolata]|uniref:vesicular integral-membrane protein VIP36-like n=1 Tax=Orbicella faveolata TaxID=48498 RepID=UPI0009E30ECE|nr:vesicular integral-membrane protein VIP36-like [Orbicella faveolata]